MIETDATVGYLYYLNVSSVKIPHCLTCLSHQFVCILCLFQLVAIYMSSICVSSRVGGITERVEDLAHLYVWEFRLLVTSCVWLVLAEGRLSWLLPRSSSFCHQLSVSHVWYCLSHPISFHLTHVTVKTSRQRMSLLKCFAHGTWLSLLWVKPFAHVHACVPAFLWESLIYFVWVYCLSFT